MTIEEIIAFNDQFTFNAKDMIDFATWWQEVIRITNSFAPGPTSPDLMDWIKITYKIKL